MATICQKVHVAQIRMGVYPEAYIITNAKHRLTRGSLSSDSACCKLAGECQRSQQWMLKR